MSNGENATRTQKDNLFRIKIYLLFYIIGFICSEFLIFSSAFINVGIKKLNCACIPCIVDVSLIIILLTSVYMYIDIIKKIIQRIDLILVVLISGLLNYYLFNFGQEKYFFNNIIWWPKWVFGLTLLFLPLMELIELVYLLESKSSEDNKKSDNELVLFNDNEIEDVNDDKFFTKKVIEFSKVISNQKGPFIFGVEGSWGVGKTSFINLCASEIKNNHNDAIVYFFNPLQYDNPNEILDNFVRGLISKIEEERFCPELLILISNYWKLISDIQSSIKLLPINFSFKFNNSSISQSLNRIADYLKTEKLEVIIVIDDIDRLDFATVKRILFLMRNIFRIPQFKFIICYDIENIIWSAQRNLIRPLQCDADKIKQFIDKYVDYTFMLIHPIVTLKEFSDELESTLESNRIVNHTIWITMAHGIKQIYESNEFGNYIDYLSTPRSIKRLLSLMIRIASVQTPISEFGLNSNDLVHFIFIYLYYPKLFKSLYYEGTNTNSDTFNLNNKPQNLNTKSIDKYTAFRKRFSEKEKILLDAIFPKDGLPVNSTDQEYFSRAIFNAPNSLSTIGNLKRYLELIADAQYPELNEQAGYYYELADKIILSKIDVDLRNIFSDLAINNKIKLWNVIINTGGNKFNENKLDMLLNYAIDDLKTFYISNSLGLVVGAYHAQIIRNICYLLDKYGDLHFNNKSYKYRQLIANKIFDERNGALALLESQNQQPIIILFDLLMFRGMCDIRYNFELNKIAEALLQHSNFDANNINNDNAAYIKILRELSQYIYKYFKKNFTENSVNIFESIELLPEDLLVAGADSEKIGDKELFLAKVRYNFEIFVFNQIGSIDEGCGYYDTADIYDRHGINEKFSSYLTSFCFRLQKDSIKEYCYFINFMLISYSLRKIDVTWDHCNFKLEDFKFVLPEERIIFYWQTNGKKFKDNRDMIIGEEVFIQDKFVKYSLVLDRLFDFLDKVINR